MLARWFTFGRVAGLSALAKALKVTLEEVIAREAE
jgi:hypothetical protein